MTKDSAGGLSICTEAAGETLGKLPASLQNLIRAIEADKGFTPTRAKALLEECTVTPEDLAPWAAFDHPNSDSYGRKMVYDGGCYELMVMSWVDGDMAAIHDHGHTQWGAVKLFGTAEHAIFKMRDDRLTTAERRIFDAGSVVPVGHDLIHQMGNRGQQPFLSMHLYGCYGRDGDITADARLYELDEGAIQFVNGGVFFALPDGEVDRRQPDLQADFPTTLRHNVELLRRSLSDNGSLAAGAFHDQREARLAAELFDQGTWHQAAEELAAMDQAKPVLRQRYLDILSQELAAAAEIKLSLLDAGLAEHDMRDELEKAVAERDCGECAVRYIELIDQHYGVDLAVAA